MREITLDTERTLESTLEKAFSSSRREELGVSRERFFDELIQYGAKERKKSSRNYANVYMWRNEGMKFSTDDRNPGKETVETVPAAEYRGYAIRVVLFLPATCSPTYQPFSFHRGSNYPSLEIQLERNTLYLLSTLNYTFSPGIENLLLPLLPLLFHSVRSNSL